MPLERCAHQRLDQVKRERTAILNGTWDGPAVLEAEARAEVSRRSRRTPKGPDPKTNNAKEA